MRGIMWGKISELSALYLWPKLLRLRGGGGGRKGGREAESGGCVSAYGRVRWEERGGGELRPVLVSDRTSTGHL